jgi:hypothetical protein
LQLARDLQPVSRRKAGEALSAMQQLLNYCRGRGRRICLAVGFLLAAVLLAAALKGEAIAIVALGRRFAASAQSPATGHPPPRRPQDAAYLSRLANIGHSLSPPAVGLAPSATRPEFTLAPPKQQAD